MARPRPALRALADAVGIVPEYLDQTGKEVRRTTDETRVRLLAALGMDVSDEARAAEALRARRAAERGRLVAPSRVLVASDDGRAGTDPRRLLEARIPRALGARVEWRLEWRDEAGTRRVAEGRVNGTGGVATLRIPEPASLGHHDLALTVRGKGGERTGRQKLIVVPPHCPLPARRLGGERASGVIANLYAVRSERSWGIGDLTDLGALLEWTSELGGAFVGVNPLHALRNRGADISPYGPVSRVYRNPIYLDVEAVPELAESAAARRLLADGRTARMLKQLRAADRVEYERVWGLKREVLRLCFEAFLRHGRRGARFTAYRDYVASEGHLLRDFATWAAIEETLGEPDWRRWPRELHDPRSEGVAAFRDAHPEAVAFHAWLQFELERQLAAAAKRGRDAGLALGLYQDLAIGTSPSSADVWASPHLFVQGVHIGAPPDPYAEQGQDWGLPPLDPHVLREEGFEYWTHLLRASLRHGGALRIDHVLGLFRQYWIPAGRPGTEGAYVRFPVDDLLGILALEATRAGALVVGEDLGTVPEEVPPTLERWGILGSKVLQFEREGIGYRPPRSYAPMALTTANTHDMATIAGFWRGHDLEIRRDVGLVRAGKEHREAKEIREAEREALVWRLVEEGILPRESTVDTVDEETLVHAVHLFVRRTPSWLVGLYYDDLAGEVEPVNVPGVGPDRYPSWTRRVGRTLEELRGDPAVRRALGLERVRVR